MKKLTVYYNDGCSKCRATHAILREAGVEFETVEYLVNPPSVETLDALLKQLGIPPEELARKGEDEYEALGLEKNPPSTREAWLKVLVENPILIERPIVTDGTRAVIARPPEKVRQLLET